MIKWYHVFAAILGFSFIAIGALPVRSAEPDVQICTGEYALCAASTCKPTGRTMTIGGVAYPQMDCKCPILKGPAIADLNGGNMKGSCAPAGAKQVWSLYSVRQNVPQEMNKWSKLPAKTEMVHQTCPASLGLGAQVVNCFSFNCTRSQDENGVEIAICHCPAGESPVGKPIAANTAFITDAGQGNQSYCGKSPVGGPINTN